MKKKIITVALVLSSVCAMAQQKENRDTDGNILRGPYETNSFWSNWYIGVGGGINIYEGELITRHRWATVFAPALGCVVGQVDYSFLRSPSAISGSESQGADGRKRNVCQRGASRLLQGRV